MSILLHECNACSDVHATSMPSAGSTYAADASNGIFTICCGDFYTGMGLFVNTGTIVDATKNLIKTFMGFSGGVITGNHDVGQHTTMSSDSWKELTGFDLCSEKIINGVHYIFVSGEKAGGGLGTVWDDGKPIYSEEIRAQALSLIQSAKDAGERCIVLTHYPLEQGTPGDGFGFRVGNPNNKDKTYTPQTYTSSGYMAKDTSGNAYDTDFYQAIAAYDNVLWLSGHTHVNWRYQSGYDDGVNIDDSGNPIAFPNQKVYKVPGGAAMINLPSLQYQAQDARIEVYDDRIIVRARENAEELGGEYNYTWYASDNSFVKNADEPVIGTSYNITTTLSNCTSASTNPSVIAESGTATLQFAATTGYTLPQSVSVSGASYTWSSSTGTLTLSNPTGNVTISIVATKISYSISVSLTGCSSASDIPTSIEYGATVELIFVADTAYTLPDTVAVSGATGSWNQSTGKLTISNPTGAVSITITAVEESTSTGSNIPIYTVDGARILGLYELWTHGGIHPTHIYNKSGVEIIFGEFEGASSLDSGTLDSFILAGDGASLDLSTLENFVLA